MAKRKATSPKSRRILALDPATACGWAHVAGDSGVWDLSVKKDESKGMRLIRLRSYLNQVREKHGVELLVFEASRNSKFGNAVKVAAQIQAVIEMWCYDNGVEYCGYSPKTIKLHATGNGNASKDDMKVAAGEKFPGVKIEDDNHADALCLLNMAVELFR